MRLGNILNIKTNKSNKGAMISLKCPLYSERLFINGLPSKFNIFVLRNDDSSLRNIQVFIRVGTNSSSLSTFF